MDERVIFILIRKFRFLFLKMILYIHRITMQIETSDTTNEDADVDVTKPKPRNEEHVKLFQDMAGADNEIDWMELKHILDVALGEGIASISLNNEIFFMIFQHIKHGMPFNGN